MGKGGAVGGRDRVGGGGSSTTARAHSLSHPRPPYHARPPCGAQEAVKCMRHSRRTTLTTADIAAALSLRNVEPLFGLAAADSVRFRRAVGHSDVVFLHDPTLPLSQVARSLSQVARSLSHTAHLLTCRTWTVTMSHMDCHHVVEAGLPCAPVDVSVAPHWLAVDGTMPATPENAPPAGTNAGAVGEHDDAGAVGEHDDAGKARPDKAWPGKAWPGKAWPGKARPGKAWPGKARPGKARPGKAWPGKARRGCHVVRASMHIPFEGPCVPSHAMHGSLASTVPRQHCASAAVCAALCLSCLVRSTPLPARNCHPPTLTCFVPPPLVGI
ncbi:unnamed protein product [Closterium sp. NIES-64]|nr:unnamed protein product [Closterium sp. NIES-64]